MNPEENKIGPGHKLQGTGLAALSKPRLGMTRWVIGALALVLSLSILSVWLFRSRPPALAGIRSLAVLPLENLSGGASQNYFADGMTDELITDLAQISALRVSSRTSVMRCDLPPKPLEVHCRAGATNCRVRPSCAGIRYVLGVPTWSRDARSRSSVRRDQTGKRARIWV
jgi:hypothetical protein